MRVQTHQDHPRVPGNKAAGLNENEDETRYHRRGKNILLSENPTVSKVAKIAEETLDGKHLIENTGKHLTENT